MNGLKRPAIGEKVVMGTLYDARLDTFLTTLFGEQLPVDAVQAMPLLQQDVRLGYDSSYEAKFSMMGISPPLACSILTGFVQPRGSACFVETPETGNNRWGALYHRILTVHEKLNISCPGIKDCLGNQSMLNPDATHFVAEIEWGVQSVIMAQLPHGKSSTGVQSNDNFEIAMSRLQVAVDASSPTDSKMTIDLNDSTGERLDVMAYSDVLQSGGIIMDGLDEAREFLGIIPLHIKDDNMGKGQPVTYSLLPLEMISFFFQVQIPTCRAPVSVPEECLKTFISIFDEFQSAQQTLSEYASVMSTKWQYVSHDQLEDIEARLRNLKDAELRLKREFPRILQSVRRGGDLTALLRLLDEHRIGEWSPKIIANVEISNLQVIDILDTLTSHGATFIGNNGVDLAGELSRHQHGDAYVLRFSRSFVGESTWDLNYQRFLKLLQEQLSDPSLRAFMAVVDLDMVEGLADEPRISFYQMGLEITDDFLSHERFMSEKCFARCSPSTFETTDIKRPIQRRFATIPCPGPKCNSQKSCGWTCSECLAPIEYGFTDDYFYCECGRSKSSNYEFKCNGDTHNSKYNRHDSATMPKLLSNLKSSNNLNILILGETGVGKSTFINALVNYLEFETLDEALSADKLHWVIPCSFSTQIMDRTNPNQEIVEKSVQVGSRSDEQDGSTGDSATQQTTVYPVTVTSGPTTYTVRLIDTPGIGDTRGTAFDKKNMSDILSTISSYDELHGILILLKSNAARLTITFQYCVKELLVHLHHSAAQNMVFGFTNTRISNYTPGDTFSPLKRLLSENDDVGLSLSINTTYCFDSESFRYLAAFKNNVTMPNKEDFDRSWKHSREETVRMISHFKSLPPHQTRKTISLNGARRNISELVKPMAEISQVIRTNIAICEDQMVELQNKRLTGDRLRKKLMITKIVMKSEQLNDKRTVCTHPRCTDFRDPGDGTNIKIAVYKTHCHPVCYLEDVPADVQAPPGLINCAAFDNTNHCITCSHNWQDHMHVLYELHEHAEIVPDITVEQQLKVHASDITLRQTGIATLNTKIKEYEEEHNIIRMAAAKFGLFLKKNSITPYNDATVAYLDFLIKAETDKVQQGGDERKLKDLTEDLQRHNETVQVLTRSVNMNNSAADLSEAGVERTVRHLYSLKHFGKNLRGLRDGISAAHQSTYRERPYMVSRGSGPRKQPRKIEVRNPKPGQSKMNLSQSNGNQSRSAGRPRGSGHAAEDDNGNNVSLGTRVYRRILG
jgi:predicted GTPase